MDLTGKKIGQIRIGALIGNGGMGDVYRGFDEKLERRVAVKVLREEHSLKREARARFLHEARILSRLNHQGICQIYDLLEHPGGDLLVLELIEGKTLRELAGDDMSGTEKLRVAATVAEILAAAHSQGIVHRDLKPDNIMVTRDRQVKILDFGIARHVAGAGETGPDSAIDLDGAPLEAAVATGATSAERRYPAPVKVPAAGPAAGEPRPQMVVGTLAYMSPEQACKGSVTAASDMFTFGLVLQELFTGQRAYSRMPVAALLLKVSRGETQPVNGLDRDLAALIEDLKAPAPERRPTAAAARDRLLRILEKPRRDRQRRRRLALAAALLLLALAALAAVVHSRLQARRQAAAAQRFGQEARDIEWLMRTVYLRPPEDIRGAREQVRERMARLRERIAELGRVGRGPGEYALGRAALALGEIGSARVHFEAAWNAGYRRPEVASALGLVLVEIYRQERARVARIPDPEERRRQLASLGGELRDPALRFLRAGREGNLSETFDDAAPVLKLDSVDYAEALIAFTEERYDHALARARATSQQLSGFYEGQALIAKIYQAMGQQQEARGDYDAASERFRSGRDAYLRAAEIGRSDPSLFLGLCELGEAQMTLEIYGRGGDAAPAFDEGTAACDKVLEIDPDNAAAYRLRANLYFRLAEWGAGDPRALLDQAAADTREALARNPGDAAAWKTLGHVFMTQADSELAHGADPRPAAGEALAAYREAHRLAPADAAILNSLGNVHSLLAEDAWLRGDDPRPGVAAAIDAYERAVAQDPRHDYLHTNAAITQVTRAEFELARGLDPLPATARARELLARSLELNPNSARALAVLADAKVIEARHRILQGDDPRALLDEAVTACGRSLAIYPDNVWTLTSLADALLARAEHELAQGGDAGPDFARALAAAERALAEDGLRIRTRRLVAAAHRGLATVALARGDDPGDHLRRAEEAYATAASLRPDDQERRRDP